MAYPLFAAAVARGVLAEQLERKLREQAAELTALREAEIEGHAGKDKTKTGPSACVSVLRALIKWTWTLVWSAGQGISCAQVA